MGRRISTVALGLAAVLAAGANLLPAAAAADTATAFSSNEIGRVIVRFKAGADSVKARAMSRAMARSEIADIAQTRATALAMRRGLSTEGTRRILAGRSLDERTQVVVVPGISSSALAARLAADGEVEMAVVDQRRKIAALPNDTLFGAATPNPVVYGGAYPTRTIDQWYLKAPTASTASSDSDVVSSINAPAAWDITTGSAAIVVAVIDTGVRYDHPDLSSKLLPGYDFIGFAESANTASVATANDGDGADADASDPGDWVSQADITGGKLGSSCTSDDISNSSWHGTRVSGLIGAISNNGVGMAGVSWGSKILPVRVLGKCGGYDSDIIAGMKWAAGVTFTGQPSVNPNPAKVLNLSLGGSGSCGTTGIGGLYRDAITQINAKGAVVVVAAGNSEGEAVGVPGNCPGVIAVAGLRHVGSKVGFSSIGPEVAISAPGGNCINTAGNQPCLFPLVSTFNDGTTTPTTNSYTGSSASVGTSFSTPLVAGTVALMLSANANLTPTQVKTILQSTARPFATSGATAGIAQCRAPTSTAQDECYCTTSTCGAGMLDAAKAVALAQSAGGGTVTVTATPATVTAGQTAALSASASLGSGLTVASTAWSVVSGAGSISGSTLTATGVGSIVVQATLTDNLGVAHSGQATVTATAAAPSGSIAITVPATNPSAGQSVALSLNTGSLGSGRTIASVTWSIVSGGGSVSGSGSSATLTAASAGTVTVQATALDNLGASYSAQATVTVAAATTTTASGSSGGGGGATSPLWLALLVLACVALRRRPAGI